ncbi:universal stress protein [Oceanibium sediminis]|uniref:universal stress protein n=1 Tax=Oceanibium sediminis TaxID=2026339 RepID=UPI000DD37309|nr:universal stress protein [Oceanibium sediminis]
MRYRNILCTYAGDSPRPVGLTHAARIAAENDGWLTAVLRHGTPRLETCYATRLPASVISALHEADDQLIAQARERFQKVVAESGLSDRATFVELDAEQGESLSDFVRTFDLIVCTLGAERPNEAHLAARPDTIALNSGRPVLVVPNESDGAARPDHVLIAWDGKRAAARAVGDVLPMLDAGSRVSLLTVGRKEQGRNDPLAGVLQWLTRHGIAVETIHEEGDRRSVPEIILETAVARGAGLVAMGAFEHSRLSQEIWGGVTSGMLQSASRPILMSH